RLHGLVPTGYLLSAVAGGIRRLVGPEGPPRRPFARVSARGPAHRRRYHRVVADAGELGHPLVVAGAGPRHKVELGIDPDLLPEVGYGGRGRLRLGAAGAVLELEPFPGEAHEVAVGFRRPAGVGR